MPFFEHGRDFQFQNSTFIDVGRDNHVHYGAKQTALTILKDYVVAGAFHNSSERFDPPKCHPETRIAVLNTIRGWYKNEHAEVPHIMWLYGPAGAGKSAIAQTVAEECHKLCTLAASFFFSRTAPGRNDATHLVPTIAYQIAHDIPDTQPYMQQVFENDPLIFSKSLETQLHQLVIRPLLEIVPNNSKSSQHWPKLIIIDGLDECNGGEVQQNIIHSLASALTQQAPPLRVLILSRPELHIRESFSRSDRRRVYVPLVLDDTYQSTRDIKLFLKESFIAIRQTHILKSHIPEQWPSYNDIDALAKKSSGQFIFASTVIRYVKSQRHWPIDRLQCVLGIGSHTDATPFAELDTLYMHILQSADKAQHATILRIFAFLLSKNALRVPYPFEGYLNLPLRDVYLALADCHSIVNIPPSYGKASDRDSLYFLHASIPDFLVDPARSREFFIDQAAIHAELVRACIWGIYSSSPTARMYSSKHLPDHSKRAHLDKALLNDLLRVNLSDLVQAYALDYVIYVSWHLYEPCLKQISWIKKQVHGGSFDIPKGLLDHHLATLDQHLRGQLLIFMSPDRVIELYSLADKIQPIPRFPSSVYPHPDHIPDTWKHAGFLLDLDIVNAYQTVPGTRDFILCNSFTYPETKEIEELYLDFLRDQDRAGQHHINQDVYTRIALQCIKYICGELHENVTRSQNIHGSEDEDYESEGSHDSEASHNPRTCKLGFGALPSIISLAAPSAELAASLRSGKSAHWVGIGIARAEYLKKYDSWEKQQPQSGQEADENPRTAKRPRGLIESPKQRSLAKNSVRDSRQQGKPFMRGGVPSAGIRRGPAGPSGLSREISVTKDA